MRRTLPRDPRLNRGRYQMWTPNERRMEFEAKKRRRSLAQLFRADAPYCRGRVSGGAGQLRKYDAQWANLANVSRMLLTGTPETAWRGAAAVYPSWSIAYRGSTIHVSRARLQINGKNSKLAQLNTELESRGRLISVARRGTVAKFGARGKSGRLRGAGRRNVGDVTLTPKGDTATTKWRKRARATQSAE